MDWPRMTWACDLCSLTYLCNIALAPSREPDHYHTYLGVFNLDSDTIVSSGWHGNGDVKSNMAPAHDEELMSQRFRHPAVVKGTSARPGHKQERPQKTTAGGAIGSEMANDKDV
jgi:hypothetical protein